MLASQPSVADDPKIECPEPAFPSRCFVVDMKAGEEVPMDGDLFSPDMAIKMALQAEGVEERIAIEVAKTSSTAEADRVRDAKIHRAELKAKDDSIKFLEDKVDRSFLETHGWWIGFLAGVGATVGIIAIVEHRPQPVDR